MAATTATASHVVVRRGSPASR